MADESSGIYTVLMGVALIALGAAVGVLWWGNATLTGSGSLLNPFG